MIFPMAMIMRPMSRGLTRIRRIFVEKGEHFFAYRNDWRYWPRQISLRDSQNVGIGSLISLTARWRLRSIAATFDYFHSQYSECVLPSASTAYSNSTATLFSRDHFGGMV